MNTKIAKKLATAALVGVLATASLSACETIFKAGDAASHKGSCKGQSGCKANGTCKGKSSCKGK